MTTVKDPHGVDPDDETRALDAEPSADSLLRQLSGALGLDLGDGWGDINNAGQALQKQRRDADKAVRAEARIFAEAFGTPAGRACLEILVEMTLRAQPYPAEAMLPIEAITPLVIAHNAQCNFVWSILKAIAQADGNEASKGKSHDTGSRSRRGRRGRG